MAKLTIRGVMVEGEAETVCAVAEGEFEVMEAEMPEDYREQLDIEATAAEQIMAAVNETSEKAAAAQTEAREAKDLAESVKEGAGAAAEEVAQALQSFDKAISATNERVGGVEQKQAELTQSVDTLKSDTESIKKDVADLKENGGGAGTPGTPGANGLTPYIKDGYWWIGEENTNVKAEGKDGKDGKDGAPGYTPVKGVDYFTASDKAAIVQDVLAALPYYDGDVTISGGVELISFTIDGNTYEAEAGMTWYEWTNSSYPYSPDGSNNFTCASTDSLVMFGSLTVTEYGNGVVGNDLIDSSVQYSIEFL
jgi:hypothetical protein